MNAKQVKTWAEQYIWSFVYEIFVTSLFTSRIYIYIYIYINMRLYICSIRDGLWLFMKIQRAQTFYESGRWRLFVKVILRRRTGRAFPHADLKMSVSSSDRECNNIYPLRSCVILHYICLSLSGIVFELLAIKYIL
jgi:hypothetical protein